MGAKDSKPSFISYEDAARRVSDSELRRIREAFKRCASGNGATLSFESFVHEVLCDGVPTEVAEWLYQACGGTKRGITFKDLLCGIVVLTKGSIDEKIKFLWTLYVNNQHENGIYIYKWDFARTLHLENTSLPVTNAPKTAEILTGLFGAGDKVTYEQFRSWLLMHRDATVLSKWLLSERNYSSAQDLETPTFYQSLAGVTHLEERDIIELEKCFWSLRSAAPTGQLDAASLAPLLAPPLPAAAVPGVVLAFDENRDGHVDFKELCCGLSAACRGPKTERLKFCFKIFDLDRDGALSRRELADMVAVLCQVANESASTQSRASTPDDHPPHTPDKHFDPEVTLLHLQEKLLNMPKHNKPVFQLGPTSVEDQESIDVSQVKMECSGGSDVLSEDAVLALEDFLIWSVESAEELVGPFLDVLVEVCHVVLGLRPQCKHQERDIVLGWLRRSLARGMAVGQFWYLVCAQWWAAWSHYTAAPDACCPRLHDLPTDDSFTTNSTESMGSLLYRCDSTSLDSGSSSGVSSAGSARPPPPIDNSRLLAPTTCKVRTLTGEGGHLRRDVTLAQGRDFELLPDALWRALALWYGGGQPLPRQVIRPPNSDVELELYPLQLKILRHVPSPQTVNSVVGVGGAALYSSVPLAPAPPQRQLAYTAAFSRLATVKQVCEFLCSTLQLAREDVRLWLVSPARSVLLDDEHTALCELSEQRAPSTLLLEQRAADRAWPEETGLISMNPSGSTGARRGTWMAPDLPGATGLHNLGNTCYMNAALQSVWNTGPLTRYFNSGMHLYEVNTRNPLGTRGALALRYGELCKEVWSCRSRSVAPLRVRGAVSRWARGLAGGGQHDAQELLAWLLDQLHEDLNRAAPASAQPQGGGEQAEKKEDQLAAAAAWEQHTQRNKSIVTELFYGQLKSKVRCDTCGHESVRFDAFNMLSLPLPLESALHVTVTVILLDGSVPVQYGVRVSSEGTVLELKRSVAELCGLPPDKMLLVESAGAQLGRALDDHARVRPRAYTLYEVPASNDTGDATETEEQEAPPAAAPEVSAPRSALCMPALFCFKRSRSEILMSQSPPGFYEPRPAHLPSANDERLPSANDVRCNTLPKNLRPGGNCSPTLSVKSLNLRTNSPRLGKAKFGSSPSNMHQLNEVKREVPVGEIHYLVAVHRKQCRLDAYFLPPARCRPALFGAPLLVPLHEGASGRALYAAVWAQVSRLLSRRPPRADPSNHAADCDDSLGYEYPFTLRLVDRSAMWCCLCPWSQLCRGCPITSDLVASPGSTPPSEKRVSSSASVESDTDSGLPDSASPVARARLRRQYSARGSAHGDGGAPSGGSLTHLDLGLLRALRRRGREPTLAIDWDPTALHLRYQTTREKACIEHGSVRQVSAEAARPIDLDHCLSAFTCSERLEQRYHCAACRSAQPATKKLQIWRLPPILIVHLKRFQYVNNKWIKSQKVVNFPFEDFDPTAYLASVPQETILRHQELLLKRRSSAFHDDPISESETDDETDAEKRDSNAVTENHVTHTAEKRQRDPVEVRARKRLESTSLVTTPVLDDNLIDYHQHHLVKGQDPFDLKYRLYAVVSHSGQLSGGHYVAYARNPSGAWLCYNDSSCRELPPSPAPHIDPSTAYLLFYERRGLDAERYLPDVTHRQPVSDPDLIDPDDTDLKKMCSIV